MYTTIKTQFNKKFFQFILNFMNNNHAQIAQKMEIRSYEIRKILEAVLNTVGSDHELF